MNNNFNCDIIQTEVSLDYMNENVLIGTAMLNEIWNSQQKDLFDLLIPFLKYSIDRTTKVNEQLDISKIKNYFRKEFGYENIPTNVIRCLLNRLSPKILIKKHNNYILIKSLSSEAEKIYQQRQIYKEHREKVGKSLSQYLNEHFQSSYNTDESIKALIDFFVTKGFIVVKNPKILEMVTQKNGKLDYYIANFIIDENNRQSIIFDYINDMVKGFFVSAAISTESKTGNMVKSKFKDTSFFLDTTIIIQALGFKLKAEKENALEMIEMLKNKGAKVCCFQHTMLEIKNILRAYKHNLENPYQKPTSFNTLEAWDEQRFTPNDVDNFLAILERRISSIGIEIINPNFNEKDYKKCDINCAELRDFIGNNILYKNQQALDLDVNSVSSIYALRAGNKSNEIEKCGYIFVTPNTKLEANVNSFFSQRNKNEISCVISDIDLSSIIWIKNYSTNKDYPKSKLIENALISLEPSNTFMENFFDIVEKYRKNGGISDEEAVAIRTDIYCRRQLMNITNGNPKNIKESHVPELQNYIKKMYLGNEYGKSEQMLQKYQEEQDKNKKAIDNAISEISKSANKIKRYVMKIIFTIFTLVIFIIILISLCNMVVNISKCFEEYTSIWGLICNIIVILLGIWGVFDLIFSKKGLLKKKSEFIAEYFASKEKEKKKKEFEKILGKEVFDKYKI